MLLRRLLRRPRTDQQARQRTAAPRQASPALRELGLCVCVCVCVCVRVCAPLLLDLLRVLLLDIVFKVSDSRLEMASHSFCGFW